MSRAGKVRRQPNRIAVFVPNLVGDTVMATPALRALRDGLPSAHIIVVAKSLVAPVLDGATWFDERILFSPRAKDPMHHHWRAVQRLRAARVEVAVLLPNSFRAALMAWLAGIPRRIGYDRGGRRLLLTDRLSAPRDKRGGYQPTPAVEYYLALVRHLGCRPRSIRTELFTTPDDEQAAARVWARLGLDLDRRVVCLNTGGAFGPAKNWPIEYFVELARRLVNELDVRVLVLCGPNERDNARQIAACVGSPNVVSLAGEPLSIGLSKACVRRASLLITTDSGPRHFAGALGVPVITLFGPTHIAWTRTYHANTIHLQVPVSCGPCQQPVCHEGHHRCMRDLHPNAVFDQAARLLEANHLPVAQ